VTSLFVNKLMDFGQRFSIWAGDYWYRTVCKLSKPKIHELSWYGVHIWRRLWCRCLWELEVNWLGCYSAFHTVWGKTFQLKLVLLVFVGTLCPNLTVIKIGKCEFVPPVPEYRVFALVQLILNTLVIHMNLPYPYIHVTDLVVTGF
jgi:hypothetical protein